MKLLTLLPLLFAPLLNAQNVRFIRPEPSFSDGTERDYSTNPVYTIGTQRTLEWTELNATFSIVMYQERPGDNFEYVFQNSKDISDYTWNVGTRKNLRNGRVFFFQIFIQGETSPIASSRYFNISDGTENVVSTSTTSSSTSLFATSSSTSSSVSTSTGTSGTITGTGAAAITSPTGTNGPNSAAVGGGSNGSGGLSSGAKIAIGLGVSIPLVIVAAALAACIIFRRRRKAKSAPTELAATSDYTNNVPPTTHEKYSEPSAGELVPNASQEQAGGFYKPVGSEGHGNGGNGVSEMYSPPVQPQELPSQRYA